MINPTQKYGFKIEVDQFGYKYPTQDFYCLLYTSDAADE